MNKNHFLKPVLFSLLIAALTSCNKSNQLAATVSDTENVQKKSLATPTLLFQTAFTNTTLSSAGAQYDDFSGSNLTSFPWNGTFGNAFKIYYEEGDYVSRKAVITTDDGIAGTSILKYFIYSANVLSANPQKARIQTELYNFKNPSTNQGYKNWYQSVRMKLGYSSFNKILQNPNLLTGKVVNGHGDWFTLAEFWNNTGFSEAPYGYRISLGLKKNAAGNKFLMEVNSEKFNYVAGQPITYIAGWNSKNSNSAIEEAKTVEIGQWMTVETYFKEGTAGQPNGRFWVAVTPDGGSRKIICDVTNYTQNPSDPNPMGMKDWCPLKMYTAKSIIDAVIASPNPQTLQMDWDDYYLWTDKVPQ